MRITLLMVGKTSEKYIAEGVSVYIKRLSHYCPFSFVEIPDLRNTRNLPQTRQKENEATLVLKNISPSDHVILLDETGATFTSIGFSAFLNKKMVSGLQHLVFVIGGPYGFGDELIRRSNASISLSMMTFSHQMVRLFFVEQLYRAFTILKNEPYHHQ